MMRQLNVAHVGMGVVLVGREPLGAAGLVSLPIPGAVVDLDPALGEPASCLVGDIGLAHPVLGALFGDAVADAALRVSLERRATPSRCPLSESPVSAQMHRLAAVRWCHAHSPLLDRRLLDLEEQVALGLLQGVLPADPGWEVRLVARLGALVAGDAPHSAPVEALVLEALDVLAAESTEPSQEPDVVEPPPTPAERGESERLTGPSADAVEPTDNDPRTLTACGVAALRLWGAGGGPTHRDSGLGLLRRVDEAWRAVGAIPEAALVRALLTRPDGLVPQWRLTVAEKAHGR